MKHPTYTRHLAAPSDIREHLGLLRGLALECDVVVELGFRSGVSTSAFLAAERPVVHSFDLAPDRKYVSDLALLYPKFCSYTGDSREVEIPPCDMLFIDTDHTEATTRMELSRHSPKVKRWIVLHDTKTFGRIDRRPGMGKGIMTAIEKFLKTNPLIWRVQLHINNNNGLTILQRIQKDLPF